MPPRPSAFRAPFLREIALKDGAVPEGHPFDLPVIAAEPFRLAFDRPVTVLVGPNGSGKSTILEAVAELCGLGRLGGTGGYWRRDEAGNALARQLRARWLPKVSRGFFLRAESLFGFIQQMDAIAAETDRRIYDGYGGRSLAERSHGEGFLAILRNRIAGRGLFILDEPEAALSPMRQIELLRILRAAERRGDAQILIATHSPVVMAYPGAAVLHMTEAGVRERHYSTTEHYEILRRFYLSPDAFLQELLSDL